MSTTHQFQADILYANPDPLCKVCGRREAEHNDDEPALKKGWLKRQLDQSAQDVATWPRWMRRAVSMTEPTTTDSPYDHMNLPDEYDPKLDPSSNFAHSEMRDWYAAKARDKTTTDRDNELDVIEMNASSYLPHDAELTDVTRLASDVLALIERLKATDVNLEIRSEQLANVQNRLTKERKEHEEQVGREIRIRNNVIAELEAERDELKESLRTTRLEQAAKAFQVDELETKVRSLLAAIESRPKSP